MHVLVVHSSSQLVLHALCRGHPPAAVEAGRVERRGVFGGRASINEPWLVAFISGVIIIIFKFKNMFAHTDIVRCMQSCSEVAPPHMYTICVCIVFGFGTYGESTATKHIRKCT